MRILIEENYKKMSRRAAWILAAQLTVKPDSVLGLATGSTPLGMYEALSSMCSEGTLSFRGVKTFNLDEYIGLGINDAQSYRHFMQTHLFNHVDIASEHINIPNGLATDIEAECRRYESAITSEGGIDVQVLGIGHNGHIGFNEPDVRFEAATHRVDLDESTISANARFFDSAEAVPRQAISMGIKTIMKSRRIVLIASGSDKADIVAKMLYGPITPSVPASILQLHPDLVVVLDQAAAKSLEKMGHVEESA